MTRVSVNPWLLRWARARADLEIGALTHEIPSTSKKQIKIPDACIRLDVRFMTPFTMLRTSRARFVLPTP